MKKAPDAFRTISEVAEILETPAHVLRFWESKFYQIKPVKRAGGRRYYRPDDVALINGIRNLLQEQGMTIRGVQRVLQENGVKHVAAMGATPPPADVEGGVADPQIDTADEAHLLDLSETVDAVEATPEAPNTQPVEATEARGQVGDMAVDDEALVTADETEPAETPMTDDSETFVAPEATEPEAPVEIAEEIAGHKVDELRPAVPAMSFDALSDVETQQVSERARIARSLRITPRGKLGDKRDPLERLGRRIDILLERMSEASGAGRW